MKRIGMLLLIAAAVLLLPAAAAAQDGKPEIKEVISTIDELYRHDTSHTVMEMEIVTPHWSRTLELEAWSEGMDKTMIRILQPQKERGMGTLRIGNEMWNYLPKTNKVMKIPPSMMMSSWMGSDFKNNDLVKEFTFTEDYDFSYTEVDDPQPGTLYIRAVPKPDRPIVWGHVLLAVDRESYLPKWEKYYAEDGELMRVMRFGEVKEFDGIRIPAEMELVPKNKEGHKTVLRYLEAEFDQPIRGDVFSLRNLRTFRR
jgi:outer membrane lipoprotein-sorting protein